jgi:hypothetical protein
VSAVRDRRKIRRALGPQAANALLEMDTRALDIERFLLLSHSIRRRLWWILTGRF